MPAQAGQFDRQIEIHAKTATFDSYGAEIAAFDRIATVWAGRLDVGGRELLRGGQFASQVTTEFTIRTNPAFMPDGTMRVVSDGQTYDVVRVSQMPRRNDGYTLSCKLTDLTGQRP